MEDRVWLWLRASRESLPLAFHIRRQMSIICSRIHAGAE
jgi:hypothetical protein